MKQKRIILKKFQKILPAIFLIAVMVMFSKETAWAEGTEDWLKMENGEGNCGATGSEEDITCTVYDSNADGNNKTENGDTLVFSGSGKMADFSYLSSPWNSFRETLKRVEFEQYNNITYIGKYAFSQCKKIDSIVIPSGVTDIGNYAFEDCSGLTDIEILSSVTNIASGAFEGCSGLTSIEIPSSVTNIGEAAFQNCSGLTGVTLDCTVAAISVRMFKDCSSLKNITIPSTVTSIGNEAFYGCTGLESIIIPDNVIKIDANAFSKCTGLENITLSNNLEKIGSQSFYGCNNLINITIPDSVIEIANGAFSLCNKLSISVDAHNSNYSSENGILYNKNKSILMSYPAATGDFTIPNTVTSIANRAFYGCSELTDINIPLGVTDIGDYAFYGCSGLTSIEIPSSVTNIGDYAFGDCTGLTSIIIPESVTDIGNGAFYGCSELTSIKIPSGVTYIWGETFSKCTGLTSIIIPEKVRGVYYDAFWLCSNLKELYYPSGLNISYLYDIDSDVMQASYKINEDNTIYVTIENLPADKTNIILPEEISGKQISSISYGEGIDSTNVTMACTKHFPNKWECDDENHWVANSQCMLCGQPVEANENEKEAHYFGNETIPCKCGYPISIEKQPEDIKLAYGYGEGTKLSVLVSSKTETNVEYQWYENNNVIDGATESEYMVPTGKEISDYEYYCKITCGECVINSDSATVSVEKAQGEINIETGKERVSLNYSEEPVLLEGITKIGEGILNYEVTEGSDVISVSEDGKVSTLKLGTATISVSMAETIHYKAAETKTIVIKVMTDYPQITPDTPRKVANTVKKVSDVSLPTDWQWDNGDKEKTLPAGEDLEVTANYTGEGQEFYNNLSVKVIIKRADCVSSDIMYTGEGEKAPTCTSEGKGHRECTICEDVLESNITVPVIKHTLTKVSETAAGCTTEGQKQHWKCLECKKLFSDELGSNEVTESSLIIKATGHTGGSADCSKKAVCTTCLKEYGELDKSKHGETEVRNAKEADCVNKGYTGDEYCKACEEKVSTGKATEKLEHTWDGGVITKEPTQKEKGVKTYTCTVCGKTKTEEIPVKEEIITPTVTPTVMPTTTPTVAPTATPTITPTVMPTTTPTVAPTVTPTITPTVMPTTTPTVAPTATPTVLPTVTPTVLPTVTPTVLPTVTPTVLPTVTPTVLPTVTPTVLPTATPTVIPTATPTIKPDKPSKEEPVIPKKGDVLTDKKTNAKYKIIVSGTKNGTVEYTKSLSKNSTKISVPATVKINGITYKVVSIAKNAFKNNKKVTEVTIGKNVKTIGANAFYGCKKLKTVSLGKNVTTVGEKAFYKCSSLKKVTLPAKVNKIGKQSFYGCKDLKNIIIKTTKLTKKNVGSKAFTGINKKATIKVPKNKEKAYQKLLETKGVSKTVKMKK